MYTILSYLPTLLLPSHPPFAQFVKQNIFVPLGMNSTTYSFLKANQSGKLAQGFAREWKPTEKTEETLFDRATPRVLEYAGWELPGGEDGSCMLLSFDSVF